MSCSKGGSGYDREHILGPTVRQPADPSTDVQRMPSPPSCSTSRRFTTSTGQGGRTTIFDANFTRTPRLRPRHRRRSSTVSNGNDVSLSSIHDSDDQGLSNSEHTFTVPAQPQPLRFHAPLRRQSDPHLAIHDSRAFRVSSPTEDGPLLTYASLPPTPISTSPPPPASHGEEYKLPPAQERSDVYDTPFSLWDYLREELLATDFDSHQELKWERVSNFLSIPLAIEKVGTLAIMGACLTAFKDNIFWLYSLL
jgi:hypothetical protein